MAEARDADRTGMSVTPSQFNLIGKLMDVGVMRHRVTSQNIANVNTPGYQAREVRFEEELARQLDGTETGAADHHPEVVFQEGLRHRVDGNNVDIDKELGQLQKNELHHSAYTRILTTKIAAMRSAITGR